MQAVRHSFHFPSNLFECTGILRARCQHSSARQVASWSIPPPAAPLHGSSLQVIEGCPPARREIPVLGRLRRQGPAQCKRAWSECIMRWGHARGRTTSGRVPSALTHRRLSASGLRAGGEASRLRFGKLWPWRSRYWGSASCSLRFSLRTRRLACHFRELLHRTETGVAEGMGGCFGCEKPTTHSEPPQSYLAVR